jgi:hypothetical protein
MKIFKSVFYLIAGIVVACCLSFAIFYNIGGSWQNKITTAICNTLVRSKFLAPFAVHFDELSVDVKNSKVLFSNACGNFHGLAFNVPKLEVVVKFNKQGPILQINFAQVIVNNSSINNDFSLLYSTNFAFSQHHLLINSAENNSCKVAFNGDDLTVNTCQFTFGQSSLNLDVAGKLELSGKWLMQGAAHFRHLPVQSYNLLKIFIADKQVFSFWDDFILAGNLSGDLQFNSSGNTGLTGQVSFDDVALKYDHDFLPITNLKASSIIAGNHFNWQVLSAKAGGIDIKGGGVDLLWLGADQSTVKIDLAIAGKASSINEFISPMHQARIQKYGINFTNAGGNLTANVKVAIPLAVGSVNSIDVVGRLEGFKLDALEKQLQLSRGALNFSLNNDSLRVAGQAMLNDYPSDISYLQDLPYTFCQLNSKIKMQDKVKQISQYAAFDGLVIVKANLLENIDGTTFVIKSDLTNNAIHSSQFNFTKPKGLATSLEVASKGDMLKIKVSGYDKLNILGEYDWQRDILSLQKFDLDGSGIKAKVAFGNSIRAQISGHYLDLSDYDLFNFLKKQRSKSGLELELQLDKVILKNQQFLKNVDFKIRCDKVKCFEGRGRATLNNDKLITFALNEQSDYETWDIFSNNAGSLLNGVGLFSKVKNGKMRLHISTKRDTVAKGGILPIVNGKLLIDNFSLIKTPFITKVISMTSLPGIVSFITNNPEIKFSSLDASFAFYEDRVTVADCDILGPSFDLSMKGDIDIHNHDLKLKGSVIPSMYYINNLLKMTPILSSLVSKKRRGVIAAPFVIKDKY